MYRHSKAESRRQALDDPPQHHPDGLVWMMVVVWAVITYLVFNP